MMYNKTIMKRLTRIIPSVLILAPVVASAYLNETSQLIHAFGTLVQYATTVAAAIALLVFFWGLVRFIYTASEEGKSEGKMFMIWGLIALFVMVSVWGIIYFISNEIFGVYGNSGYVAPPIPIFNQQQP